MRKTENSQVLNEYDMGEIIEEKTGKTNGQAIDRKQVIFY